MNSEPKTSFSRHFSHIYCSTSLLLWPIISTSCLYDQRTFSIKENHQGNMLALCITKGSAATQSTPGRWQSGHWPILEHHCLSPANRPKRIQIVLLGTMQSATPICWISARAAAVLTVVLAKEFAMSLTFLLALPRYILSYFSMCFNSTAWGMRSVAWS